jgi:hypothetical protein
MSCRSASLSAWGHANPPRADRTLCTSYDKHARRPPFLLVRGPVRDQSAGIRARGAFDSLFERACPTVTQTSYFAPSLVEEERVPVAAELRCVRELRRERSARGSTSKPLAAASGPSASSCISSFRAAGLHARPSSRGPALVAYAEQSPAHATVKRCSPRSRRSLVERRRTAAAPGQKKNANPGKRICSRQTEAARTKLKAGSERKMESSYADHHKCAGSEGYSSGKAENVGLVAWRRLTCVVS